MMIGSFLPFEDYGNEDVECLVPAVKNLFCPWTWKNGAKGSDTLPCVPLDRMSAASAEDALVTAATPWHRLVEQVAIAYSHGTHKKPHECHLLLAECYMPLLPIRHFDTGCSIIAEHKEALRHLLDASWSMAMWGRPGQPDKHLTHFIEAITPFQRLSSKQQAALYAVQASLSSRMGSPEGALRRSVVLNPSEGTWQTMLGEQLLGLWTRRDSGAEGLGRLREGLRLRRNPYSLMALATALAEPREGCPREANALVDEALSAYPGDPHVLFQAAGLLPDLRGKTPETYKRARAMVERASKLTADRAVFRNELGRLLEMEGRVQEAHTHYRQACRLVPTAASMMQMQRGMALDPDLCSGDGPKILTGPALDQAMDSCRTS